MRALAQLQNSILFQAAQTPDVANRMTSRARTLVAFGVLVAAGMASTGAVAQSNRVLTPAACASVGATVVGALAAESADTGTQRLVRGALGALFGAAGGNWICGDKDAVRGRDSSYEQAGNYGMDPARGSVSVDRAAPKEPLSESERAHLERLMQGSLDAKYAWKLILWEIDQASQRGDKAGVQARLERESEARAQFEQTRHQFASTVAQLYRGTPEVMPRAVGRYLEVSGALLELNSQSRVSYASLAARDEALQQRSPTYAQAADIAARNRNIRG